MCIYFIQIFNINIYIYNYIFYTSCCLCYIYSPGYIAFFITVFWIRDPAIPVYAIPSPPPTPSSSWLLVKGFNK